MKILLLLLSCSFYYQSLAQPVPYILWENNYGGSNDDYAGDVDTTAGNGYIIVGSTRSDDHDVSGTPNQTDFWIIKVNAEGNLVWNKNYGGSQDEAASAVRANLDGSFIIVGSSNSDDGNVSGHHGTVSYSDFWVIKLNALGNIIWKKSFGGSDDEAAQDVRQTSDGGFIVTGWTNSTDGDVQNVTEQGTKYWIIKLSANGSLEWQKTYRRSFRDISYSIEQTSDNGYVIVGSTIEPDGEFSDLESRDYWIIKMDSLGTWEWDRSIGTSLGDCATSVCQSPSGGIAVIGFSDNDYRLIELDLAGNIENDYTFGGNSLDFAKSIRRTSDNGYILAGDSQSWEGDVSGGIMYSTDFWITKLNADTITWETRIGTPESDYAAAAVETPDGYLIVGHKHNDGGSSASHYGNNDIWLVKIGVSYVNVDDLTMGYAKVFPNPFADVLHVEASENISFVQVYDLLGKLIFESDVNETINLNVNSGAYVLRLFDKSGINQVSQLIVKK